MFFRSSTSKESDNGSNCEGFRTTDKRYRQFEVSKGNGRSKLPQSKERGHYDQGASGKKLPKSLYSSSRRGNIAAFVNTDKATVNRVFQRGTGNEDETRKVDRI